jgi:hypothetical protein
MKWPKKIEIKHIALFSLISCMFFMGSCDVAYHYDIESGTDDYTSDSSNVSIATGDGIDVSMYGTARIFPGLVDTLVDNPIRATITLDLSKKVIAAYELGIQQVPRPIYSTGLYAGAGELITLTINDNTLGLRVIVGSHLDDLTAISPYLRLPVVTTSQQLFPGKNTIRNPLGGMIWIEKNNDEAGNANFTMQIDGAYQSPDFIVDVTDANTWLAQMRATTVPWLELRGKHVAFSVQRQRLLDLIGSNSSIAAKMQNTLKTWDEAIETYYYNFYDLYVGSSDDSRRAPDFPERVVLDVELLDNLYIRNADYGIVALNINYMLDELSNYRTLKSGTSVAMFNALARNYTFRSTKQPYWSEVSGAATAFSLYRMAERGLKEDGYPMGAIFLEEGGGVPENFPNALIYADTDSSRWFTSDVASVSRPAYALASLVQLANYKGNEWAFFENLNYLIKDKFVVDNSTSTYFFEALCDYFKEDFSPFFEHWGFTLTDEARGYASKYPLMAKTAWKYSPLAANPSAGVTDFSTAGYHFRHNRTGWAAFAYDNMETEISGSSTAPSSLLDGNRSTGWSSRDDNAATTPTLPFALVIDMKKAIDKIDGIFLAGNNTNKAVANFIIETLVNPADVLSEEMSDQGNFSWRTIMTIDASAHPELTTLKSEAFYDFPSRETGIRYLRIRLTQPNATTNWSADNLANHKDHVQAFNEFGTFYYK